MHLVLRVQGNQLWVDEKIYPCAIGKSGFSKNKKEGDGGTPVGVFPLRECWYRADRMPAPQTALHLRVIGKDDGWCDDPNSPDYNRHIKRPYAFSHEALWRDDHAYDVIVPLGYNDNPVIFGKGSAIFLHVAKGGYTPTEGCVALALPDLLAVLSQLAVPAFIEINGD